LLRSGIGSSFNDGDWYGKVWIWIQF
jgi:hypothetical protein